MADETTPTPETTEDEFSQNTVEVADAGTLKKKITVTVHRDRIDGKLNEMFGELSTTAQIPGFRVGRAPRRLLEKRFGKEVGEDVRNAVIGEAMGSAIEEAELKTLGEPDIKLDEIEMPEQGDLEFSFEVEIEPEFDLPETKGIEVTKEIFDVDNERIDEYIQDLREGQARYEKTDKPAEEGDGVTAAVKITGEGVEWENPRVQLRVAPGVIESLPLVDLGDDLKGVKDGDTVKIETKAPETHPNEDWQGKDLTVELTVHEVSKRIVPELDEEFARARGFDSLEEFREFISSRLQARVEMEIQNSLRQQICDYLLEKTDFELPEGVVRRHTARALQRQYIELLQSGVPREKIDENMARLQAAAEEKATRDLKLSFILGKIAEAEGIDVNEGEINSRVAQMAAMYNRRPERLRQELAADGSLEQVGVALREEKALDKLLEEAEITEAKESAGTKKAEKKAEAKAEPKVESEAKAEKKTAKKSSKKAAGKTTKKTEKKTTKKSAKKKTAKKKTSKKSTSKKSGGKKS